ncbi:MAG TPA: inositol monophosphatase family protein [Acetobacteraceae bacterium]|jgi:myo-inositol-1(or 4)-monophosphatase
MPESALQRRLDVAVKLAEKAGQLALRLRPPPGAPVATLKGAQDWLTEADGAVEAFLSDALAAAFPEDGFEGEESGRGREGALRWVVDPIDGTANYARGGSRFCVSLGLIEDRTALLGVLVAPALGEVFAARQGGGATLNNALIRAATTTDLSRATVECGWSPRLPNAPYFRLVENIMAQGATLRAGGSGAMGLADVAAGRVDAYVELHINLWDVAAALAILSAASAVVSPFLEGDGLTKGNAIMAAAPGIAEALQAAIPAV